MTDVNSPGSTPSERDGSKKQSQPARRRGLWLWFAAGFLAVFVGMSLLVTMRSMHPSGEFVVSCKLWRYYILEIQRALNSSGNLGPATGSSTAAVTTALQHLLFSTVGGAVALGLAWGIRRIKRR